MPASLRFPPEDSGRSLAEMAQRDLDAALQLLADRAQYITGATGAAIALRRDGKKDMMCRASSGPTAPELGALLSAEYGLSGESVRTKQLLRCDDAERDARVNREVCRQLGIASVVVMPVVHDDEVLGVFELFSGRANVFGERDLSAVQRLTQMVETAVRLAQVTENLPEQLRADVVPAGPTAAVAEFVKDESEEILDEEIFEQPEAAEAETATTLPQAEIEQNITASAASLVLRPDGPEAAAEGTGAPSAASNQTVTPKAAAAENAAPAASAEAETPKKPLFWSAALNITEEGKTAEAEQSNVPPVLRGLRKCEVCGFPITAGRTLCVECEEKKWRGQLKRPQPMPTGSLPAATVSKPEGKALAAAARSAAPFMPVEHRPAAAKEISEAAFTTPPKAQISQPPAQPMSGASPVQAGTEMNGPSEGERDDSTAIVPTAAPEFALSAGLESPQSWFAAHKFKIVMLVAAAAVVAVFLLSR